MTSNEQAPDPRFAATVVVLRDGEAGIEVLMLRRHTRVEFAGDAWVFPGGRLEDPDRALAAERWRGIDPRALAPRLDAPADLVLGFHVAAVRETFEEAGMLLGSPGPGNGDRGGATAARAGRIGGFEQWLAAEGLVLDLGALTCLSRWVTPPVYTKRFDTVFFLAREPGGQVVAHDRVETTAGRWLRPVAALEAREAGEMSMMHPTSQTLRWLAEHRDVSSAVAAARAQPKVPLIRPHAVREPDGTVRVVASGEAGDTGAPA